MSAGTDLQRRRRLQPLRPALTRNDGEGELSSLEATLPKGLAAKFAGIPYCPDAALAAAATRTGKAEQSNPSCPASRIGTRHRRRRPRHQPLPHPRHRLPRRPLQRRPDVGSGNHPGGSRPLRPRHGSSQKRPLRRSRDRPGQSRLRPLPQDHRRRPPEAALDPGQPRSPQLHPEPDQLQPRSPSTPPSPPPTAPAPIPPTPSRSAAAKPSASNPTSSSASKAAPSALITRR